MHNSHTPVLIESLIKVLQIQTPYPIFVDATFGAGGYSKALLNAFPQTRCIYAVDRDPVAFALATALQQTVGTTQIVPILGRFSKLKEIVNEPAVDAVLFDVGLSSMQISDANRGFSFNSQFPIDMRMGTNEEGCSASDIVNGSQPDMLIEIFRKYGEEEYAREIANAIASYRFRTGPIQTCKTLSQIVTDSLPRHRIANDRKKSVHPARKIFQALRISVNEEIKELEEGLEAAHSLLRSGGMLAVVTFHSLECQAVKRFFARNRSSYDSLKHITNSLLPTAKEVAENNQSRSGRLRYAYKK